MLEFIIVGAIFFFVGLLLYLYLDFRDYKSTREFIEIEK
jgi:hypothetical protein